MYTSDILDTGTLDFSRADLMATAPSSGAGTVTKDPLNCIFVKKLLEGLHGNIPLLWVFLKRRECMHLVFPV